MSAQPASGRKPLTDFVAGAAALGAVMAVGGLVVVQLGLFDTRASTPHGPILAWATHTTFVHAAQRAAGRISVPAQFTPAEVEAGFKDYDASCAACHGGPGLARADWTQGLNPSPPYLVSTARNWTPGELYWVVKNGVKMTAMPAWGTVRSDGQVWDLVAFLEALPYLSADDYTRMRRGDGPPPQTR